jgi:chromosome segregation ATPase
MKMIMTLGALVVFAGCGSSTGVERASAASSSMADFRENVKGGQQQLDRMIAALNGLESAGGDLKPAYQKYVDELARTETYAATLKADADAMRSKGREFFTAWENEINQIKNEEMKAKAKARAVDRTKEYAVIEPAMGTAKAKWEALSSELRDVKQYLANDLTSKGVASLSDTISKANLDAIDLKKALGTVSASLERVKTDFDAQAKQ